MERPWLYWKYDLCENEVHCEGKTIALSETSLFDIEDKKEFSIALQSLAMKLGWLVERANSTPDLLEALHLILVQRENFTDDAAHNIYQIASEAIAKLEKPVTDRPSS